ncbi:hypothetical protein [Actinophytocola sp.]|uniref:hypothetical protein n=1 Tax=Actinophytocola sp. TaxID=1872138 RepID=UPI003D6B9E5C
MRHTIPGPVPSRPGDKSAALVAIEVVLLWPRGIGSLATVEEAGLWPVFVLVVGERSRADVPSAAPLLDLVDRPRHDDELAVVAARCQWSVVDLKNAVLKVAVRAEAPERFAAEILVPARQVLGVLDVVARGGTIGITTPRHAATLSRRVHIRQALREVVLLGSEPSTELAALANLLRHTTKPGG